MPSSGGHFNHDIIVSQILVIQLFEGSNSQVFLFPQKVNTVELKYFCCSEPEQLLEPTVHCPVTVAAIELFAGWII